MSIGDRVSASLKSVHLRTSPSGSGARGTCETDGCGGIAPNFFDGVCGEARVKAEGCGGIVTATVTVTGSVTVTATVTVTVRDIVMIGVSVLVTATVTVTEKHSRLLLSLLRLLLRFIFKLRVP